MNKILHICTLDKFIPAFVDLVERSFEFEHHMFILFGDINKYPIELRPNVIHWKGSFQIFLLLKEMQQAQKIILHGIFNNKINLLLAIQPWLLKKCYWVVWGGDLYLYQLRTHDIKSNMYEAVRAFVIRRMGHFVTYVKSDYELAQQWYGATGQYHECLMYPSNLYKEYVIPPKTGTAINILVGNSATSTNNHTEIFEKLSVYKNEDVMIYCPLSYGDSDYAKLVAQKGIELFGGRFVALMDFMPFEKYLELLGKIDIAIFAHKRQQAMGNTITVLGLGKKVFMRSDVTQWRLFEEIGVKVFDVSKLSLEFLADDAKRQNIKKIKELFSEKILIEQYSKIFG